MQIDASVEDFDFYMQSTDVAIVRTNDAPAGSDATFLFRHLYFPVVSKETMDSLKLRHPSDLKSAPLLASKKRKNHWLNWLAVAGAADVDIDKAVYFESSSNSYTAARNGGGVALASMLYVAEDLAQGRLVAPFQIGLIGQSAISFAVSKRRSNDVAVKAFHKWLVEEICKTELIAQDALPDMRRLSHVKEALSAR